MICLEQQTNITSAYFLYQTGIFWHEIEYPMSCDQRSSSHIDTDFRLVKLCKQEFRVSKYGNQLPENELLYQENILYIYISNS